MRTAARVPHLPSILFSKTRLAVLTLLLGHPDESFYLRQIVRTAGTGLGATQRELNSLFSAGILQRFVQGKQVYYQANRACPVFKELRGLILKTGGVSSLLATALSPLAPRILAAFIFGSLAEGREDRRSDIDLLVIGDLTFEEIVSAVDPLQAKLCREINPVVYPPLEFQRRLKESHHFVSSVLKDPKIFLIGDQNELDKMAPKRVAEQTHHKS